MKCPFCKNELVKHMPRCRKQSTEELQVLKCEPCKIAMPTKWWTMQEKRLASLPVGDR